MFNIEKKIKKKQKKNTILNFYSLMEPDFPNFIFASCIKSVEQPHKQRENSCVVQA